MGLFRWLRFVRVELVRWVGLELRVVGAVVGFFV